LNNGIVTQILEDFQKLELLKNKLSEMCVNFEILKIEEFWNLKSLKYFESLGIVENVEINFESIS
jgi:hypothetical protein